MTAIANDLGFEEIFAHQLGSLAEAGDVLIAISSSGASANIVKARQISTCMSTSRTKAWSKTHILTQYMRHAHLEDSRTLGQIRF